VALATGPTEEEEEEVDTVIQNSTSYSITCQLVVMKRCTFLLWGIDFQTILM